MSVSAQSGNCSIDSVKVSSPGCAGYCDGAIDVFASGMGNISYYWQQFPVLDTSSITDICAGQYIFSITDTSGCTVTDTVLISDPDSINYTLSIQSSTCPGGCTGMITIIPGDSLPYSYHWPGFISTGPVLNNICAGTYNAIITDTSNCSVLITATVDYANPFNISFITSPASCPNSCDGTATAIPDTTGVFDYQWLTGPIQNTQSATGLCVGTYLVNVSDSLGCVVTDSVNIDFTAPPVISSTAISPTCYGGCDGQSTIITDTLATYSFEWLTSPPQFNQTATGLCSGNYNFIVTDLSTGCMYTDSVYIDDPLPYTITSIVNPSSCNNFCNGSAVVSTNAPIPLMYQWTSGSTGPADSLLCPGLYEVIITDADGCTETASVSVGTQQLVLIADSSSCNAVCDGIAEVILPFAGDWLIEWNTLPVQNTLLATGLCPGSYSVTLTDTSGCIISDSAMVVPGQPIQLNTVTQSVSCFGLCNGSIDLGIQSASPFSLTWDTNPVMITPFITGLCSGTYIVNIIDTSGCTRSDTIQVSSPSEPDFSFNLVANSCYGICDAAATVTPVLPLNYSYYWQTNPVQNGPVATNLCPGNVTIIAIDSSGCVVEDSVYVLDNPEIILNANTIGVTCNGDCDGFASVQPFGGTPGYSYLWSNGYMTPAILNVCGGNYTITVTDSKGCTAEQILNVNEPDSLMMMTSSMPASCSTCNDGSVSVSGNGGTLPYIYVWNPGGIQGATLDSLTPGIYNVCIVDANSCAVCQDVQVTSFNSIDDLSDMRPPLFVYPNPVYRNALLKYTVREISGKDEISFILTDVTGRQVSGYSISPTINPAEFNFEFGSGELPGGVYVLNIFVNNKPEGSVKLIVL